MKPSSCFVVVAAAAGGSGAGILLPCWGRGGSFCDAKKEREREREGLKNGIIFPCRRPSESVEKREGRQVPSEIGGKIQTEASERTKPKIASGV